MRVAIHTLECKVNQYESQAMEEILTARGHTLVPFEDPADVYIVNSCTVTATSDKKSRQAVRQARKRAPEALVALCGCYPQVSPEDARKIDADLIGGSGDRLGFLDLLEQMAGGKPQAEPVENLDDPFRRRVFEALPAGGLEGRTRAMLKVEDGCTNFCTYCIIPYARGAVRSLPADQAAEQAKGLARQGYRELVITGICPAGRTWPALSRPCAMPCRRCGSASAPWSRARSRRISAPAWRPCPTSAPTSTSPCKAAATRYSRACTGATPAASFWTPAPCCAKRLRIAR